MTTMTINEAWWQLFTLTGSIEAYLLYRGILEPVESSPSTTSSPQEGRS
ncbi:YqzL family protein [Neomoorella mulderi]|nr:YqzL family protein [Moorella mulderi]